MLRKGDHAAVQPLQISQVHQQDYSAPIMSWFADLAGKAEDLLNRVDQGAATALSRKENTSNIIYSKNTDYSELHQQNTDLTYQTGSKTTYISSAADNIRNQKATILAGTANVKVGSRTLGETSHPVESASAPRPSSQFVRRKKSEPDDELLFDFLNSSQKHLILFSNFKIIRCNCTRYPDVKV